jgi:hypothetical protein
MGLFALGLFAMKQYDAGMTKEQAEKKAKQIIEKLRIIYTIK